MRILALVFLLSGCASVFDSPPQKDSTIPLGGVVWGNAAWADYCARHAADVECR